MGWARILAYITGTVDQELLLRNEYLAAENRILKAQIKTRLRLTDAERVTLAEIAHRLGRKALEDVANVVKPDTLLGWYRRLVARKFDGSKSRRYPGRPIIDSEIEQLVVRIANENTDWGYDRIVGAMANLGHRLSDQTVGNILQRHGIPIGLTKLVQCLGALSFATILFHEFVQTKTFLKLYCILLHDGKLPVFSRSHYVEGTGSISESHR